MRNNEHQVAVTKHATDRMKQRCIPPMVIDWLLDYGLMQDQGETRLVYFSKKSKKQIRKYAGPSSMSFFNGFENAYAILAANDDKVITTGYKTKGFRREMKCKQ